MDVSLSRTMEELSTLQILRLFSPARLAILRASRVSAVSPLWLMVIERVSFVGRGSLYLNSDAISMSHRIFEMRSKKLG